MSGGPVLRVEGLARHYVLPRESLWRKPPVIEALAGVSLAVGRGESLGIVGESGSGKSTLARLAMALEAPTAGRVDILGKDVHALPREELRHWRRHFQMVFQDPYSSLDPRQTVRRIVAEPLGATTESTAAARDAKVAEALVSVGLREADMAKYPHEFSGGQRQRVAIARALITRPALIVADEPVSALDVSVQAQVLNLLQDLRAAFSLSYLFISHDLAVVRHVCDRVAVMYKGRIVEEGPTAALFQAPAHPYTKALLAAVPGAAGRHAPARPALAPAVLAAATGKGCPYVDRCPRAEPRCLTEAPALREGTAGHRAACHFAETVAAPAVGQPNELLG